MKNNIIRIAILGIIPLILLYACMDNAISNPEEIIFPESNITYTQHVEPLLRFACNAPGCHNLMDRKANIILDSYEQLLMSYGGLMIRKGDPDNSLLIKIIRREVPHSLIVDYRVNTEQLIGLARWIKDGAPR